MLHDVDAGKPTRRPDARTSSCSAFHTTLTFHGGSPEQDLRSILLDPRGPTFDFWEPEERRRAGPRARLPRRLHARADRSRSAVGRGARPGSSACSSRAPTRWRKRAEEGRERDLAAAQRVLPDAHPGGARPPSPPPQRGCRERGARDRGRAEARVGPPHEGGAHALRARDRDPPVGDRGDRAPAPGGDATRCRVGGKSVGSARGRGRPRRRPPRASAVPGVRPRGRRVLVGGRGPRLPALPRARPAQGRRRRRELRPRACEAAKRAPKRRLRRIMRSGRLRARSGTAPAPRGRPASVLLGRNDSVGPTDRTEHVARAEGGRARHLGASRPGTGCSRTCAWCWASRPGIVVLAPSAFVWIARAQGRAEDEARTASSPRRARTTGRATTCARSSSPTRCSRATGTTKAANDARRMKADALFWQGSFDSAATLYQESCEQGPARLADARPPCSRAWPSRSSRRRTSPARRSCTRRSRRRRPTAPERRGLLHGRRACATRGPTQRDKAKATVREGRRRVQGHDVRPRRRRHAGRDDGRTH